MRRRIIFRHIRIHQKNKANTLALYNALNNSSYTNEEELEITTIEDAIYLKMKNDLSFVIADTMNLYEQQSTYNPNMPLRGFIYYGSLYAKYMQTHRLTPHVSTLVKIPTPNYIVFYNGITERPASEKLRLSDAFQFPDNSGEFEWTATVINLKHDENKAVEECIQEDILADFLKAHRAEVLEVYLSEVDEDILRECLMEEGISQGIKSEREATLKKLRDKIQRKIAKGKNLEQIAEELEEDVEDIRPLYKEFVQNPLM